MRARTSSERLLSWVEVASIACGQRRARSWFCPVECRERHAEAVRLAADLVQGYQPVVLIEGRVFHRLGHHRGAVLLKFHGEGAHCVLVCLALAPGL